MNKEPILVIADILANQMSLTENRIFIYNDGRELPKDTGMYLVLSIQSRPPYGVERKVYDDNGVYKEKLSMNVAEKIFVSCVSKNTEARKRAYEIQLAMSSTYAIQQMEKYGFHIGKISTVIDNSALEATARLNRFDCEINILTWYEKINEIDYYDQFPRTQIFEP